MFRVFQVFFFFLLIAVLKNSLQASILYGEYDVMKMTMQLRAPITDSMTNAEKKDVILKQLKDCLSKYPGLIKVQCNGQTLEHKITDKDILRALKDEITTLGVTFSAPFSDNVLKENSSSLKEKRNADFQNTSSKELPSSSAYVDSNEKTERSSIGVPENNPSKEDLIDSDCRFFTKDESPENLTQTPKVENSKEELSRSVSLSETIFDKETNVPLAHNVSPQKMDILEEMKDPEIQSYLRMLRINMNEMLQIAQIWFLKFHTLYGAAFLGLVALYIVARRKIRGLLY